MTNQVKIDFGKNHHQFIQIKSIQNESVGFYLNKLMMVFTEIDS